MTVPPASGTQATPEGGARTSQPPSGEPAAWLRRVISKFPSELALTRAPGGEWQMTVTAAPDLTGQITTTDLRFLEQFADAYDAYRRAQAHMCECGHSFNMHQITSVNKHCNHIPCGCLRYRRRHRNGVDND